MSASRIEAFQNLMRAPRALIVEDEPGIALCLSALLSRCGVLTKCVARAEEATRIMDGQSFDLAFVNLRLHGMPGDEFVKWAGEHHPNVPCIVVSGLEIEDIVRRCTSVKIFMAMQKPVTLADIDALLLKLGLTVPSDEPIQP